MSSKTTFGPILAGEIDGAELMLGALLPVREGLDDTDGYRLGEALGSAESEGWKVGMVLGELDNEGSTDAVTVGEELRLGLEVGFAEGAVDMEGD